MSTMISIQVIKVYHVEVDTDNQCHALVEVDGLTSLQIAERGKLKDVMVDYSEIVD